MGNRVYIDDSGKPDHSPVLVLAGYLASDDRWKAFDLEWREILKRFGTPTFHATEVWRLGYRTKIRSRSAQTVLLVSLIECINRHLEHLFVVSIPFASHAHWFGTNELTDPELRIYASAFYSLMTLIHQHAYNYRFDVPLQVVFDEQGGENTEIILRGIDHFRGLSAQGFPGLPVNLPLFMSDDDVPGLQAADLIAWLARKDGVNAYDQTERANLPEAVLLDRALLMPKTMKIWQEADVKAASDNLLTLIKRHVSEA
ncbi:UNVERIFIED_ORG: hypothetical protein J2W66_004390 [Agrobacterium larrymoorei]|nr:hypothetical protein [Agrobacterium larrymoorei]